MEVRKYLIASLIILVVKVLFGFLLNSNALLASSILEVMFIVFNLLILSYSIPSGTSHTTLNPMPFMSEYHQMLLGC